MGITAMTPGFILTISAIYQLRFIQSPGGLANIRMTNEFLLFIIPAITSQYISMAVKIVEMSVGPTTWKKLEEHANKAMRVKAIIELIAVHQMGVMVVSDKPYWVRFVVFWASIGTMVFMHVSFWMWSKEVKQTK